MSVDSGASLGSFHGVSQKHRDRHRSHAAGHRRNPPGNAFDVFEVDVAGEFPFRCPVGADIDHYRSRLHHLRSHQIAPAHRGDQDVGGACIARRGRAFCCAQS